MQSANHADGPLTPASIFDMLQAHQRTAALKAAIELDVFRAVGEGPGDVLPSRGTARRRSEGSASSAIS